jgi:hypothetical protein
MQLKEIADGTKIKESTALTILQAILNGNFLFQSQRDLNSNLQQNPGY